MAKEKTQLQKDGEAAAAVALSSLSVIKNKRRKNDTKDQEIKVIKPKTPEAPKKRRGRPTINDGDEKQEKRCTLYLTTELFEKIESVARIKKLSINQFFLQLAKSEIEKPEYVKLIELLNDVDKK